MASTVQLVRAAQVPGVFCIPSSVKQGGVSLRSTRSLSLPIIAVVLGEGLTSPSVQSVTCLLLTWFLLQFLILLMDVGTYWCVHCLPCNTPNSSYGS